MNPRFLGNFDGHTNETPSLLRQDTEYVKIERTQILTVETETIPTESTSDWTNRNGAKCDRFPLVWQCHNFISLHIRSM